MNTGSIGVLADPHTDSQSLPQYRVGQTVTCWPVAPSMWLMTFWAIVDVAHRNSPVARSSG